MAECCLKGFNWTGNPAGHETTIAENKTYVAGSNPDVAILMIHDVYGWTFNNLRLLADAYAKEADATVYLPDFFGGEVVPDGTMEDPELRKNFDFHGFFQIRNSKAQREPEIFAVAKALRSKYKRVATIGFCFGGWAVFRLGAKGNNLVDAISMAHPSLVEESEIRNVGVPVQILAPETDVQFTPELKAFANKTIPSLGVAYDYQYFPGLVHGFAVKGDPSNKLQKAGFERAKNAAVQWFVQYLHNE